MENLTIESVVKAIREKPKFADVLTTDKLRDFAQWAVKGEAMPLYRALHYMVAGYMENCGISPVPRTLYFEAGEQLFERITGERECSQETKAEGSKEFGTTSLTSEDYLIYCMEECAYNIPDAMKAALCYGIFLRLTAEKCVTLCN